MEAKKSIEELDIVKGVKSSEEERQDKVASLSEKHKHGRHHMEGEHRHHHRRHGRDH